MRNDCMDMLQAIIAMLDGAKYLWQGTKEDKEKTPIVANVKINDNRKTFSIDVNATKE